MVLLARVIILFFARISQKRSHRFRHSRKPIKKPTSLSFRPSEARGEISVINIDLVFLPMRGKVLQRQYFSRDFSTARGFAFHSVRLPPRSARNDISRANNLLRKQNHISAPAHSICRYLGSRKGVKHNNRWRVAKPRFCLSAPNLSHTCDLSG